MSWDSSPLPSETPSSLPDRAARPKPAREGTRVLVPAVLFVCTLLTTLVAGSRFHAGFVGDSPQEAAISIDLLSGLPFAFTILIVLLAHEMGHYLTCRFYRIKATLPYMIPFPPLVFSFGTLGAVIKIKSLFENRRQLFDVGIAGPLGGFILIVPAVVIGLQQSKEFVLADPSGQTLEFGEPLLFRLCAFLFFPGGPDTPISLHPIGWAAWFGMLATSLNLLPIGQLDGGHIVYALFGSRSHKIISFITFGSLVGLSLFTSIRSHYSGSWPVPGYLVFALLLLFLGFRHPRPRTEFLPLDKGRFVVAIIGLIIFILTFIPVPVRLVEHVGRL